MKKKSSKIIDILLIIVLTAGVGYLSYNLFITDVIPQKYRIAGFAIFTLIYLILIVLHLYKIKGWKLWLRRIFALFLCTGLVFASLSIGKLRNAINGMADAQENDTTSISVITLNDSDIKSIDDLSGKNVAYQNGMDKSNGNYVKKKLDNQVNGINYSTGTSYIALAQDLIDKKIDALIITDSYIQDVNNSIDNFKTTITKVKTYKRKVDNSTKADNTKDLTKETFTILLSGVDTSDDGEESNRSDVNMVLIVNPLTNHVEMASLPRDSYIPNLALNSGNDKLTHTGNDGIDNTISSIENVIGFKIDYYVQVNFTSVVKIVDTVGGINVNVPIDFCEQNSQRSFAEEDLICLKAGEQLLNGEQALAVARHRHSYTDLQRTEAQQAVIKGLINKLMTTEGAAAVPGLLDILPDLIKTNVSSSQLNNFINYELEHLDKWSFGSVSLENGNSSDLPTASMGDTLLSCYVLNINDLRTLYYTYQIIKHPTTFNKFTYDKNNLYEGLDEYEMPDGLEYVGEDYSETPDDYTYDQNYTDDYGETYDYEQ